MGNGLPENGFRRTRSALPACQAIGSHGRVGPELGCGVLDVSTGERGTAHAQLRAGGVGEMSVFHDEVEIEDFEYDEETETYSYPCPCGDRFLITREQFVCGEVVSAPTSKELVKC
uniref:Diphthamide biosynthesis protein 3 n=1 Tax=Gopherus evgoodei TaxID=1825980 RepID=A0A8C4W761_9SAUR